jgi:flagellin
MGLFIQTNIPSLNAQRHLYNTSFLLEEVYSRLSSGLRINSAKDDAAGLSISTRFTAQIRGLNAAVRNSEDGISLAQTAQGALSETTSILQRIRELAVQSSSDTYNESDRASMQAEVEQLTQEIDRIAEGTTFNGNSILDGTFLHQNIQVGAHVDETLQISIKGAGSSQIGQQAQVTSGEVSANALAGDLNIQYKDASGSNQTATVRATVDTDDTLSTTASNTSAIAKASAINRLSQITGVQATVNATTLNGGAINGGSLGSIDYLRINGEVITGIDIDTNDASETLVDSINAVSSDTGVLAHLDAHSQLVLTAEDGRNIQIDASSATVTNVTGLTSTIERGTLTLESDQQFELGGGGDLAELNVSGGVYGINSDYAVSSINISTSEGGNQAIKSVDRALEHILSQQGQLGAIQNRFDSTIANLQTSIENLSDARSRILDADYAAETARLAQLLILQEAGVSVLSQANQSPQIALALLGS